MGPPSIRVLQMLCALPSPCTNRHFELCMLRILDICTVCLYCSNNPCCQQMPPTAPTRTVQADECYVQRRASVRVCLCLCRRLASRAPARPSLSAGVCTVLLCLRICQHQEPSAQHHPGMTCNTSSPYAVLPSRFLSICVLQPALHCAGARASLHVYTAHSLGMSS